MFSEMVFDTEAQKTEYEIRHRKSLAIRRALSTLFNQDSPQFSIAVSILKNEGLTEAAIHLEVAAHHFWEAYRMAHRAANQIDKEERECTALVPSTSGYEYKISQ